MFMGINSHRHAGRVTSYADAQAVFDRSSRTSTGKKRRPRELACAGGGHAFPLGLTKRGQTEVIRYADNESIAFRLYVTDVVTWYPDDSISIENYGTVTTSAFASRFLPTGFHFYYPTSRRGSEGGHKGIGYQDAANKPHLCWGDVVCFTPDGDGWTPDPSTLDTIEFPALDRVKSRELAKRFHLVDFANWLSMAPRHLDIEHDRYDVGMCLDALEARDFRKATTHLPLIEDTGAWGFDPADHALPIATPYNKFVTMGSLTKLKLAMRDYEGAFDAEKFTTIGRDEFDRRSVRAKQLNALTHSSWGATS